MRVWAGCAVLVLLLCGCGAQAAGTVSAPPTPTPKPKPARPAATPTATQPTGPAFHLDGVSTESPSIDPGAPATLDYTIENNTGANQAAVLGASAYSQSDAQNVFSDSTNDESVTLVPGTHVYRRSFVFPQAAGGQTFDLVASVNTTGFAKLLDEERYSGLISVNAPVDQALPADTPTPEPDVSDPNTAPTSPDVGSGDTYQMVNDHPELYQGDTVQWTCHVYKFLDPNTIACWEYTGTFDGMTGDGSVALDVTAVDASSVSSGDDIEFTGTVSEPFQGVNGFGGPVTSPEITVSDLTDLGSDSTGQ